MCIYIYIYIYICICITLPIYNIFVKRKYIIIIDGAPLEGLLGLVLRAQAGPLLLQREARPEAPRYYNVMYKTSVQFNIL